nr:uncharacterized protein LOC105482348 isoform X3 [Macaca nemestrina]
MDVVPQMLPQGEAKISQLTEVTAFGNSGCDTGETPPPSPTSSTSLLLSVTPVTPTRAVLGRTFGKESREDETAGVMSPTRGYNLGKSNRKKSSSKIDAPRRYTTLTMWIQISPAWISAWILFEKHRLATECHVVHPIKLNSASKREKRKERRESKVCDSVYHSTEGNYRMSTLEHGRHVACCPHVPLGDQPSMEMTRCWKLSY